MSSIKSHFGCCANTPLSNISTSPKHSDLSYVKVVNQFLDRKKLHPLKNFSLKTTGLVIGATRNLSGICAEHLKGPRTGKARPKTMKPDFFDLQTYMGLYLSKSLPNKKSGKKGTTTKKIQEKTRRPA